MDSIAVTKANMTVSRQETLSPFGLLSQLFTAELARRSEQTIGSYRPMQLAYLEEPESEAQSSAPEIHFDLDINLLLDRLRKDGKRDEKEKNEKQGQAAAERILERVILREKEIRTVYRDTRRVVIENGGQRITAELPVKNTAQPRTEARSADRGFPAREIEKRQAGEGRSTQIAKVPRRSAGLAQPITSVDTVRFGSSGASARHTVTLASQAMSVPAAGGWTPQHRELHPGYPTKEKKEPGSGLSAGSILLPDVMRRRREEVLEQRAVSDLAADDRLSYGEPLEEALTWAMDEAERTTETERVIREVRRAVEATLRRNGTQETARRTTALSRAFGDVQENAVKPEFVPQQSARKESGPSPEPAAAAAPERLPAAAAPTKEAGTPRTGPEIQADTGEPAAAFQLSLSSDKTVEGPKQPTEILPDQELHSPDQTEMVYRETAETAEQESGKRSALRTPPHSEPARTREDAAALPEGMENPARSAASHAARKAISLPDGRPEPDGKELPARYRSEQAAHNPQERELRDKAVRPAESGGETVTAAASESEGAEKPVPSETPGIAAETNLLSALPRNEGALPGIEPQLVYRDEAESAAAPQTKPDAAQLKMRTVERPVSEKADVRRDEASADAAVSAPGIIEKVSTAQREGEGESLPAMPAEDGPAVRKQTELFFREETASGAQQQASHSPVTPLPRSGKSGSPDGSAPRGADASHTAPDADQQRIADSAASVHSGVPKPVSATSAEDGAAAQNPAELVFREETDSDTPRRRTEATTAPTQAQSGVHTVAVAPDLHGDGFPHAAPVSDMLIGSNPAMPGNHGETKPADAMPAEDAVILPTSTELIFRDDAGADTQRGTEEPAAQIQPRTEERIGTEGSYTRRNDPSYDTATAGSEIITGSPAGEHPGETKLPSALPTANRGVSTAKPQLVFLEEAGADTPRRPAEPAAQSQPGNESRTGFSESDARDEDHSQTAQTPDTKTAAPAAASEPAGETKAVSALPAVNESIPPEHGELVFRTEAESKTPSRTEQNDVQARTGMEAHTRSDAPDARLQPGIGRPFTAQDPDTKTTQKHLLSETGPETGLPFAIPGETEPNSLPASDLRFLEQEGTDKAPAARSTEAMADASKQSPEGPETEREPGTVREPGKENAPAASIPHSTAGIENETAATPSGTELLSALPASAAQDTEAFAQLVYHSPEDASATEGAAQSTGTRARESAGAVFPAQDRRRNADAARGQSPAAGSGSPTQKNRTIGLSARDIRVSAVNGARTLMNNDLGIAADEKRPGPDAGTAPEIIYRDRLAEALPLPSSANASEPSELVFAAQTGTEDRSAEGTAGPAVPVQRIDSAEQLPAWAKDLLEQSGVKDTTSFSSAFSGNNGKSSGSRQFTWTAPGALDPSHHTTISGPADLAFRERPEKEEQSERTQISESEIQRTADKVYKIIEERLRRELRRSGR